MRTAPFVGVTCDGPFGCAAVVEIPVNPDGPIAHQVSTALRHIGWWTNGVRDLCEDCAEIDLVREDQVPVPVTAKPGLVLAMADLYDALPAWRQRAWTWFGEWLSPPPRHGEP